MKNKRPVATLNAWENEKAQMTIKTGQAQRKESQLGLGRRRRSVERTATSLGSRTIRENFNATFAVAGRFRRPAVSS